MNRLWLFALVLLVLIFAYGRTRPPERWDLTPASGPVNLEERLSPDRV